MGRRREADHSGRETPLSLRADVVHASFNTSDRNARLLAILGPCIGPEGYELVDVADQEPWAIFKADVKSA